MTLYRGKYRIESSRLQGWDYRSRGWYFVTICSHNRLPIFGVVVGGEMQLSPIGQIVESEVQSLERHYRNIEVDERVVMPNHVHVLIMIDGPHVYSPCAKLNHAAQRGPTFISPEAGSLSAIIRSYKAGVTNRCRESGLSPVIWQPRFHDHILRGDEAIGAVRGYIRNNPANWEMDRENQLVPILS